MVMRDKDMTLKNCKSICLTRITTRRPSNTYSGENNKLTAPNLRVPVSTIVCDRRSDFDAFLFFDRIRVNKRHDAFQATNIIRAPVVVSVTIFTISGVFAILVHLISKNAKEKISAEIEFSYDVFATVLINKH